MEDCSDAGVRLLSVGALLQSLRELVLFSSSKTFIVCLPSTLFRGHLRREHRDLTLRMAMAPFPSPGSSEILEYSSHTGPLTSWLCHFSA